MDENVINDAYNEQIHARERLYNSMCVPIKAQYELASYEVMRVNTLVKWLK